MMTSIPRPSFLRRVTRPQPRELTVSEIHRLLCAHASATSVLRYQEAVGQHVAGEIANHADLHARGFSRVGAAVITSDNITHALSDLAGIIRRSTFPHQLIDLCQEEV